MKLGINVDWKTHKNKYIKPNHKINMLSFDVHSMFFFMCIMRLLTLSISISTCVTLSDFHLCVVASYNCQFGLHPHEQFCSSLCRLCERQKIMLSFGKLKHVKRFKHKEWLEVIISTHLLINWPIWFIFYLKRVIYTTYIASKRQVK